MDSNWEFISKLNQMLSSYPEIQAIVLISCISAIGIGLGRIKFAGISLGAAMVFFTGIIAGHLGLEINPDMLSCTESFGLVIFVYALGLQVGPGFFSSFREGGIRLNLFSLAIVLAGTLLAVALMPATGIGIAEMAGVLCGATTNTPALGAAQQTLRQLGMDASGAVLSCAAAYPFGIVGVVIAIAMANKMLAQRQRKKETTARTPAKNKTFIAEFKIVNANLDGMKICEVSQIVHRRFVISRLWRDGEVIIPIFDTQLKLNDHILVITAESELPTLAVIFGEQENKNWNRKNIDWNKVDSHLISQRLVVTNHEINGKTLGELKLRNHFGINITRVYRAGVELLATPRLRLQIGDKITAVGEKASLKNVETVLGNAIKSLKEPNLVAIFIGIMLGLLFGIIPISFPGIGNPVRLGLAGGPIIAGILIGAFGPRFHMATYTTRSVNLMLRALGLSVYLACLGIDSGRNFFETVMCANGLLLLGCGILITFVPVFLAIMLLARFSDHDTGTIYGTVCAAMANPTALDYANSIGKGERATAAYATAYPLAMLTRVIIAQLLFIILL